MKLAIAAMVVGLGGVAAADPLVTDFVTLERYDDASRAGAELTYFAVDGSENGSVLRFDIFGQYVDPSTHAGGYLDIPAAIITGTDDLEALGDIALGGLFNVRVAPEAGFVFHAGLTLPTVKREDELPVVYTNIDRPRRIYQGYDVFSIDFGGAFVLHSGSIFGRADIGITLPMSDDNYDSLLSGGLGGGFDFGTGTVGFEFQAARPTKDGADSLTDVAVSMTFRAGRARPYVAIALPLDDKVQSDFNAFITLGVTAKL